MKKLRNCEVLRIEIKSHHEGFHFMSYTHQKHGYRKMNRNTGTRQVRWLKSVILATKEAELRRMSV
jgi:hypothetical protein